MPNTQRMPVPNQAPFIDLEPPPADFYRDVIEGLSQPRREISPKYLYDAEGSRLFDQICQLPEYYLTRTEIELLKKIGPDLNKLVPEETAVIEYGSGSSVKIRTLLNALHQPSSYMAMDISREHLLHAADALSADFPTIDVYAVCADFTIDFDLPSELVGDARKIGFLPGSTIGNFAPDLQAEILTRFARQLGPGAGFLIGIDLIKDKSTLENAYNDSAGVTAAFSLNLLRRIRRELGAEMTPDAFKHVAQLNDDTGIVEIWLEATKPAEIRLKDHAFRFERGDKIHTELSQKYTIESFRALAQSAGFTHSAHWTDDKGMFSLHFLTI